MGTVDRKIVDGTSINASMALIEFALFAALAHCDEA